MQTADFCSSLIVALFLVFRNKLSFGNAVMLIDFLKFLRSSSARRLSFKVGLLCAPKTQLLLAAVFCSFLGIFCTIEFVTSRVNVFFSVLGFKLGCSEF